MESGSVSFLGRLLDGDGMVTGLAWSPDLMANLFFCPRCYRSGLSGTPPLNRWLWLAE